MEESFGNTDATFNKGFNKKMQINFGYLSKINDSLESMNRETLGAT